MENMFHRISCKSFGSYSRKRERGEVIVTSDNKEEFFIGVKKGNLKVFKEWYKDCTPLLSFKITGSYPYYNAARIN